METPINLAGEIPNARTRLSVRLSEAMRKHRQDVLTACRNIPAFVSAPEKLTSDGNRYRALVSKENLCLLREGAKGIAKPWLRDRAGRFVENVDLGPGSNEGVPGQLALVLALRRYSRRVRSGPAPRCAATGSSIDANHISLMTPDRR
jgi:hypothetical protein